MSDVAVEIMGVSKRYRLGMGGGEQMLREVIQNSVGRALRTIRIGGKGERAKPAEFWAVKDVSFTVRRGEVIGIVGRNGEGKSTLLKILSRITDPTEGRVRIHGRVGSLLEVGTGFHPELTGRENIFLNGAILGMKRSEIKSKFDQIVDFSGIEAFIDTPVKRYSSGMYVRLAFAVAAHLEPEILIIDEVLAVGDMAFQKKCLGQMQSVARQGRTVLFVSHNMDAVMSLCTAVTVLEQGHNSEMLLPEEGIRRYLGQMTGAGATGSVRDRSRIYFLGKRSPILTDLLVSSASGGGDGVFPSGDRVTLDIGLEGLEKAQRVTCCVALLDEKFQRVAIFHTDYHSDLHIPGRKKIWLRCEIPSLPLTPGEYIIEVSTCEGRNMLERVEDAARLHVHFSDLLGTGMLPDYKQGHVVIPASWVDLGDKPEPASVP